MTRGAVPVPDSGSMRPALEHESLYLGIDVGKQQHMAGFVSATLLTRHQRFEACPVLKFANTREGFRLLMDRIQDYVTLEQCFVLVEKTGHYHLALVDYLLQLDLAVYVIHVQKRPKGMLKSDRRDALGLANHLYNQLAKGIQLPDRTELVRRALPPTDTAARLKGLIGHRHELVHESTQRKNKLTALCDQLFPEFTQVFHDPNLPSALAVRARFSTAPAVASARLDALCEAKGHRGPNRQEMLHLQELAHQSIGVVEPGRQAALEFEQGQLIRELQLLQEHLTQIDERIAEILQTTREGRILLSMPGVGTFSAAAILSAIGNIRNFPNAGSLKAYFGWAPKVAQSGKSLDRVALTRAGERTMKEVMYLVALRAVQESETWAALYDRLVRRKCSYDERTQSYIGKKMVIGRIAGQITAMIYALLKADTELLANVTKGSQLPEPQLYDAAIHQAHRDGAYHSMKPVVQRSRIVQLSKLNQQREQNLGSTGVQEAAGFGGA